MKFKKLKLRQLKNSNCGETQKTQIVIKFKNSNCDES